MSRGRGGRAASNVFACNFRKLTLNKSATFQSLVASIAIATPRVASAVDILVPRKLATDPLLEPDDKSPKVAAPSSDG